MRAADTKAASRRRVCIQRLARCECGITRRTRCSPISNRQASTHSAARSKAGVDGDKRRSDMRNSRGLRVVQWTPTRGRARLQSMERDAMATHSAANAGCVAVRRCAQSNISWALRGPLLLDRPDAALHADLPQLDITETSDATDVEEDEKGKLNVPTANSDGCPWVRGLGFSPIRAAERVKPSRLGKGRRNPDAPGSRARTSP